MIFFAVFLTLITVSYSMFNFDELKNTHYGIEILKRPVELLEVSSKPLFDVAHLESLIL